MDVPNRTRGTRRSPLLPSGRNFYSRIFRLPPRPQNTSAATALMPHDETMSDIVRKSLLATLCWWPIVLFLLAIFGTALYVLWPHTTFARVNPFSTPAGFKTLDPIPKGSYPAQCLQLDHSELYFNSWQLSLIADNFGYSLYAGSFPFDVVDGSIRIDELNNMFCSGDVSSCDVTIRLVSTLDTRKPLDSCLDALLFGREWPVRINNNILTVEKASFAPNNFSSAIYQSPYVIDESLRSSIIQNFTTYNNETKFLFSNLRALSGWVLNQTVSFPTVTYLFDSTGLYTPLMYAAIYKLVSLEDQKLVPIWQDMLYKGSLPGSSQQSLLQWVCLALENGAITVEDIMQKSVNTSPGCLDLNP